MQIVILVLEKVKMITKIKISLTIDKDIWEKYKSILDKERYPYSAKTEVLIENFILGLKNGNRKNSK